MKQNSIFLDGLSLNVFALAKLAKDSRLQTKLTEKAIAQTKKGEEFLTQALKTNNKIVYGINTGFGPMASYILPPNQLHDLQKNLIFSHAVGMGEKLPDEFVLAAMTVRLNTLTKGHSGASMELLGRYQELINRRIIPIVPRHGAVGTSGDLVQLAHIALALLGKGQVSYKGQIKKTSAVFRDLKLKPYRLKPKEGLTLINGTSMMSGIASLVVEKSWRLLSLAARNGALALELVKAYGDSLDKTLHALRPHPGQLVMAKNISRLLKGSKLIRSRELLNKQVNYGKRVNHINESVQEIYSFRCQTQILGPVFETLANSQKVVETEINSVTDNPIIDWEAKKFLHGGNFHGDYVATAMDQLKISLAKLTMLSERRTNFFLHDNINKIFPPFQNLGTPGLTLGLQGLQFVATSTTANSQTLAYPMSLHSIPTNGDNQDVVSMGTDAALIAHEVMENGFIVLAIETLALCQAVDFLKVKNKLSPESKKLYSLTRNQIKPIYEDRYLAQELDHLVISLKKLAIIFE